MVYLKWQDLLTEPAAIVAKLKAKNEEEEVLRKADLLVEAEKKERQEYERLCQKFGTALGDGAG